MYAFAFIHGINITCTGMAYLLYYMSFISQLYRRCSIQITSDHHIGRMLASKTIGLISVERKERLPVLGDP